MEIVGECKRKKIGGPDPRVSQSFPVIKSSHSVVKTKKVNARGTVLVCNAISSSLAPYKKISTYEITAFRSLSSSRRSIRLSFWGRVCVEEPLLSAARQNPR